MAEDLVANSCCAVWKERFSKLQERYSKCEDGRTALRKGVKIFEQQIALMQTENLNLKKACEEGRMRADIEREEKVKESSIRVSLENDISALKSEILLLQQKEGSGAQDGEITLLQARVSEREAEINQLKERLEKERKRADSEKKKAEAEKKKANEAWKIVKAKQCRADEEKRLADIEGQTAEENRIRLEVLKSEADEARSKLVLETLKSEEANKKVEAERQNMIKEKKRADLEMAKAEEQRKLAETNRKKAMDEKCRADYLSQHLEQDRQRIEKLQKEIDELVSSRKMVAVPADLPDKQMSTETAKVKGELRVEILKRESDESNLVLDYLKSEVANKRLEEVKQKAVREKKRADSEMRKSEEQRKVADAYRKKAMEEKHRAEQLARELEDNKRRIEELQKEIQALVSSRPLVGPPVVAPDKNMNAETAKMKLLRKQLKFKKMQVKHVKQVAKLEIGRNNILEQELCRLKLEFIQFSQRLDILDNCFLHNDKIGNFSNVQSLNLKRKLFGIEPYQIRLHSKNELVKPSCRGSATIDASDPSKQTIECTAPVLPISGANCAESISGIDSKLEPLLRGSNRKMLQSSAINSSMGSFSDRPLVGSQERGAFSVTTATKLAEEKSNPQQTISSLSVEDTKRRCDDNIAVVAENSVRSPISIDAVGRRVGHSKKRKRILDAVESIKHLYSEGQKWHLLIADNLSMLHSVLNSQMEKPLEERRWLVPKLQGNLYSKQDRSHKRRKAFSEEEVAMMHLHDSNDQKDRIGTKNYEEANVCIQASPPVYNLTGTVQACKDGIGDSSISNPGISGSFDEMMDGNYMKLLDLDNNADEECYRMAIEVPLSPTLPELEFQISETLEIDNSKPLVDASAYEGVSNVKDNPMPCCSFDAINMGTDSNKLKFDTCRTSDVSLLQKNEGFIHSCENLANYENGNPNASYVGNSCVRQIWDSGAELGVSDISIYGNEGPKILHESRLGSARKDLLKYCVVFSDTYDSGSISRIFDATRSCMTQCSMISQTDWVVQIILPALMKIEYLLPKEKVCVFFSLLLNNFSGIALGNFGYCLDRDTIHFLDSFAGQMRTAMFDVATRRIFVESCHLDELLTLIEDFLMDGRVLVCGDVSSESMLVCDSTVNIVLNGEDIILSAQMASSHQLVAGCIILASICAAVDHVGFVCEASYNIFRMQKFDSSMMLTILHVFAHLCGPKYFTLDDYSLTMTVMKSLVTSLEKENLSTDCASYLPSLSEAQYKFASCTKCPFSEGAVSMDIVVSLLFKKLWNYALSATLHQDLTESVNSLNSGALSHEEKTEHKSGHEEAFCVLCTKCNMSSCLKKFGIPPVQSNCGFYGTLCHCSDVLSSVELVACNMNWDWTCNNIICQLLKMLESCVLENFFAAIVILLGQLGRLGVDANGYEDTGVENLRGRLSAFLCQSAPRKLGLPVQIATVTALIGLLSVNFEEIIKSNVEHPTTVSQSMPVDCVRKWFSSLSNEQQSLSFRLLQSACKTR